MAALSSSFLLRRSASLRTTMPPPYQWLVMPETGLFGLFPENPKEETPFFCLRSGFDGGDETPTAQVWGASRSGGAGFAQMGEVPMADRGKWLERCLGFQKPLAFLKFLLVLGHWALF
ncbi:hypothetical protein EPI10_021914 [Gossypium australe]|uniref:Uncharacterized protein n=1 Tax=Gossypium australe TaxID=47621 RepID=A0A5B6WKD4_9ROSI|nr:hypothetical protein EPI10_021914 [Gossypium australe]